nr:ester cyclase [Motilibacter deserti]
MSRAFVARAGWLLPVAAALLLWTTARHQPDPAADLAGWSGFVTTRRFQVEHLAGSVVGQALWTLGAAALVAAVLPATRRPGYAVAGLAATVLGGAGLLAGFGVAAFAQPAIGRLHATAPAVAEAVYDDVYAAPALVTLLGGALLWAVGGVLLALAAAGTATVPRWAALLLGASGPLIGVFGVAYGPLQTVGALAGVLGGAAVMRALGDDAAPSSGEQLVREFFRVVRSGREPDRAGEFFAPVVLAHQVRSGAAETVRRTPEGYAGHVREMLGQFGRFNLTIDELVAAGDRVYVRWTQAGRHVGAIDGVAATGRPLTVVASAVYRVSGGRITEYWIQQEDSGLTAQLLTPA